MFSKFLASNYLNNREEMEKLIDKLKKEIAIYESRRGQIEKLDIAYADVDAQLLLNSLGLGDGDIVRLMYTGQPDSLKMRSIYRIPTIVQHISKFYDLPSTDDFDVLMRNFNVDGRYYSKTCSRYMNNDDCLRQAAINGYIDDMIQYGTLSLIKMLNLTMAAARYNQRRTIDFLFNAYPDYKQFGLHLVVVGAIMGNQNELFKEYSDYLLYDFPYDQPYNRVSIYLMCLEEAINRGNVEVVTILLNMPPVPLQARRNDPWSANSIFRQRGLDIDSYLNLALIQATKKGYIAIMDLLIAAGATNLLKALDEAIQNENINIIITYLPQLDQQQLNSLAINSVSKQQLVIVRMLMGRLEDKTELFNRVKNLIVVKEKQEAMLTFVNEFLDAGFVLTNDDLESIYKRILEISGTESALSWFLERFSNFRPNNEDFTTAFLVKNWNIINYILKNAPPSFYKPINASIFYGLNPIPEEIEYTLFDLFLEQNDLDQFRLYLIRFLYYVKTDRDHYIKRLELMGKFLDEKNEDLGFMIATLPTDFDFLPNLIQKILSLNSLHVLYFVASFCSGPEKVYENLTLILTDVLKRENGVVVANYLMEKMKPDLNHPSLDRNFDPLVGSYLASVKVDVVKGREFHPTAQMLNEQLKLSILKSRTIAAKRPPREVIGRTIVPFIPE